MRPDKDIFRKMHGIKFDYTLYAEAPDLVNKAFTLPTFTQKQIEHKPTPVCYDCPDDVWCGNCPDDVECNLIINCSDCHVKQDCQSNGEVDPSECDGGSCEDACDMNCQDEFAPVSMGTDLQTLGNRMIEARSAAAEELTEKNLADLEHDIAKADEDGKIQNYTQMDDLRDEALDRLEESSDFADKLNADPAWDESFDKLRESELAEEDVVLHPNHYAEADIPSGIECWDWYELAMTEEEITGHFKGNALKYIFRAGKKGNAIEDLEKARNYLARWIGYLNGDRTVHMRGKKYGSDV
jgi:hypothetical protein